MATEKELAGLETMSDDVLFGFALRHFPDDDYYWDVIWLLRGRGTQAMFQSACEFCGSDDNVPERKLGVDILAALGVYDTPRLPFQEQSVDILIAMAGEERNQEEVILGSIIAALGHLGDDRSIPALTQFIKHPNSEIRLALAIALGGMETDAAIKTLITLSKDTEDEVRNWATFGLGNQTDRNTKAIREALAARLDDEHKDTRCESIYGLAKRKDWRFLEPAMLELETGNPQRLAIEAAVLSPHAGLLPALLHIKQLDIQYGEVDEELDEAIRLCQAKVE